MEEAVYPVQVKGELETASWSGRSGSRSRLILPFPEAVSLRSQCQEQLLASIMGAYYLFLAPALGLDYGSYPTIEGLFVDSIVDDDLNVALSSRKPGRINHTSRCFLRLAVLMCYDHLSSDSNRISFTEDIRLVYQPKQGCSRRPGLSVAPLCPSDPLPPE